MLSRDSRAVSRSSSRCRTSRRLLQRLLLPLWHEVLSLSVNHVSTLVHLQYCPKLSELYLRKNEIMDLSEILYLRHLRRMKVLWLADNPCAELPFYRAYILHHLPNLSKIDAEELRSPLDFQWIFMVSPSLSLKDQ